MTTERTEQELLEMASQYSFRSRLDKAAFTGPILAWGRGSIVRDVNGKEYLDFNSGQMCSALGHNHPRIVEAIRESGETIIHSHMSMYNDREILLAKRLADIVPRPLKKSLFGTSGSDSNEMALGIARRYTGRYEVASPNVSFHGMSQAVRAVTFAGWRANHGPYEAGSYTFLAPYQYRCSICAGKPGCTMGCLDVSFEVLDAQTEGGLAAIIVEPLFSAGGVIEPPPGWLKRLRDECDRRRILLILDEAQTGLAKLGTMWAFEQEGVMPDILTVSKHLGGGIAVSATITTEEIENKVAQTGYVVGHSHANDPITCNAGIASIDIIEDENLVQKARELGAYWKGLLAQLQEDHEIIGDVRGRGMIQGIELVKNRETKEPAYDEGNEIGRDCLANGLIFSIRRRGSVLRFVPPFSTTREQFDQAAEILDRAIRRTVYGE
jgi:2,2-dialkylglycine decarboxylase (pyruvate)